MISPRHTRSLVSGIGAFALSLTGSACSEPSASQTEPLAYDSRVASHVERLAASLLSDSIAASPGQTLVLGPASLARALAIASVGTAGGTAAEFEALVGAPALWAVSDNERPADPTAPYAEAAAVWLNSGFPVAETFRSAVENDHAASVRTTELAAAQGVTDINGWVAAATTGRIPRLLEAPLPNAQVVIATAAAFNADWATAFDIARSSEGLFTTGAAARVTTMFMTASGAQLYAEAEHAQRIRLPFADEGVVADIILPRDAAAISACLTATDPCDWLSGAGFTLKPGNFAMPRVKVSSSADVSEGLRAAGLESAFDAARADFSGMVDPASELGGLALDRVLAAGVLEMDEVGAAAAAANIAVVSLKSARAPEDRFDMRVDRPFLVFIRAQTDGPPVFVAYVADPGSPAGT